MMQKFLIYLLVFISNKKATYNKSIYNMYGVVFVSGSPCVCVYSFGILAWLTSYGLLLNKVAMRAHPAS